MNSEKKSALKFTCIGIAVGILITCLTVFIIGMSKKAPVEDAFKPGDSTSVTEKLEDGDDEDKPSIKDDGEDDKSDDKSDNKKDEDKDNKKDNDKKETTPKDEDNNSKDDPEENNSGETVTASDTWSADATYNGGDQVVYGGKKYEAKWWTQNETPSSDKPDGPWKYLGEAVVSTEAEVTEEEIDDNTPDQPAKVGTKDFKIVGYYPSWEPDRTKYIQYDNLTHINYSFAIPNNDGSLKPLENPQTAKHIIKMAHKKGVKVCIAIGGWSYNGTPLEPNFVSATSSPQSTRKFADNILKLVDEYGFDGVDMDWEHPRKDGTSSKQYENLMTMLAKDLHAKGKILTSAVLSGVTPDGNVYYDSAAHTDAVLNCVDWINVMAYDGGDGERHSGYQFAVNCGKYWKDTRNMPAHKVVLGVPFYGRPSWEPYRVILEANSGASKTDISSIKGMQAHYNGMPTIEKKTQYACENLGGMMMWELSQDSTDEKTSLLNVIAETARKNKKFK